MAEYNFKRSTAYIIPLSFIKKGEFIKSEEQYEPSFVNLHGLKISRIQGAGVIIGKKDDNLLIDDGTAQIEVREFIQPDKLRWINEDLKVGDLIMFVGKVREAFNERYILLEILRKTDINIKNYFEKQAKLFAQTLSKTSEHIEEQTKGYPKTAESDMDEEIIQEEKIEDIKKTNQQEILEYIKQNDKGDGVFIDDIVADLKLDNCEELIKKMLRDGEIYSVRAGKIKALE